MSNKLGKNIAVRWSDVGIIVLNGICNFKPEFLVESNGIFIVCLHVQINLWGVLLGA